LVKRSGASALPEKTYGYRERDEEQRQVFLQQLSDYRPAQVVYVDEAGAEDTEDYPYGYCQQGERFHAVKLGHRTCRISMIAAWCNRHILAPMTFKGTCHSGLACIIHEQRQRGANGASSGIGVRILR
jgi:hypothetical protein